MSAWASYLTRGIPGVKNTGAKSAHLFAAKPPPEPTELVALTAGEFEEVGKRLEALASLQAAEAAAAYPTGAQSLVDAASALFASAFGSAPSVAAHAPGRVNLIGEHTDYTGGFVLPLALEKRTVVVGRGQVVDCGVSGSNCCEVLSVGMEGGKVSFDANPSTLTPGSPSWANYVKGVVKQYSADLPAGKKFAFQAVYASDVPLGSGLSSSAALEVSTATFLEQLGGYSFPGPGGKVDGATKAVRCQQAEHTFCAMPCGIMDQFVSTLGQQGHLLQIDCRTNVGKAVAIAQGPGVAEVAIVVCNSNVKHALTGSEYPTRVAQCKAATAALAAAYPAVTQLRDANASMVEAQRESMDDETYRRARHVVGENARVQSCVTALEAGDFVGAGKLMVASHMSLQDDFEVSCPELDALVNIAVAFPGVYGSRMTGGGFGGCTVTLVEAGAAEGLMAHLKAAYAEQTSLHATCFVTSAGSGAGALALY